MSRLAAFVSAVAVAALLVSGPLPAMAERTQSSFVLVREDQTIPEDLYAAGDVIVVAGLIEGDLVAVAYTEIRIEGEVRGSVSAVASRVVIDGAVGGSVRVAAPDVEINGNVGDDVFVGGVDVMIGPNAKIGRDALVWGNDATLAGRIGRNIEGQFRHGTVSATVEGTVDITVSNLSVTPTAAVEGDLIYVGDERANISEDAEIGGSVIAKSQRPPDVRIRALLLLVKVLGGLGVFALGLALIWSLPDRSVRAARGVSDRPLVSLAWGLGLASIPVAMALIVWLFVSLSPPSTGLPLLLVFAPLVIAAFALLAMGLVSAPVPVGAAIGRKIGPARSVYAWFVMGASVLAAVSLVPVLGIITIALASLVGLGGWFVDPIAQEAERTDLESGVAG